MEIRYINFITYLIIIVSLLNCPKFNQLEWTQKTTRLLRQTQTLPNFWALKIRSNFWRILWFKYFSHSATLMWQGVLCIQIRDLFSREGTSEGYLASILNSTPPLPSPNFHFLCHSGLHFYWQQCRHWSQVFEFIQTNRYRCLDGHTSRKIQNVYPVLYKVNWSFGYTNCKKYWKCFPFFFGWTGWFTKNIACP